MQRSITCLSLALLILSGCARKQDPEWTYLASVEDLPAELQSHVREELRTHVGTFTQPKLLAEPNRSSSVLKEGQAVYQKRCVQCHGVSGDGNGPAAAYLYPKPRDYRKGLFKFTSTESGSRPLKEDLVHIIQRGIRGTSMPSFKLLPENEIEAVAEYVMVLSQRGELEAQIAFRAELEEEVDPTVVEEDLVPLVVARWDDALENRVAPLTPQPQFTSEHVAAGREVFLKLCSKCHGDDGRGLTAENLKAGLKDDWGNPTRAADLTSGMLHGGTDPVDIYRRIYQGVSPMPSFANSFRDEPETFWNLVAYVLEISNRRREGISPAPGPLAPYLPPTETDSGG